MNINEQVQAAELSVDINGRSYPIWIGEGLLVRSGQLFQLAAITSKSPVLIITDTHVAEFHLHTVKTSLEAAGYRVAEYIVPSGETSKSLSQLEHCVTAALAAGLDRKSTIVALGGGVVGDLAGFVASSYMRGIRFVQMPTTILAHDSSVGGKVAVNHPLAKNIIGAFHQPEMVIYDTESLRTLSIRDIRSGLSEMVKHGLIWDADFAAWCGEHAAELLRLDKESLQYGLYTGCSVKAQVVSQDERENDLRAILNLGHTIGHALEAVGQYGELLHGEAIAIGMVGSAMLAARLGEDPTIESRTRELMEAFGLPTVIPAHYDTDAIMSAMMHDKKFSEGQMVFVVPTAIGAVDIRRDVSVSLVREIVDQLKGERE
ncbi:3-dehydroquinate synthase [Paenibacillus sp. ACRRX]|uniref:3-dehydroquinate synthase n=1 Tax=unclassified Paenibacillus TaxID=185978 RepID=UPI001EF677C6|nr:MULTISPECIES: 3-dehydroquinate synthase [unclassified Paenibacillus]MCG7406456.1 3-dehydroquinate synthase [Paenibacillus sp. ACRRX]MDK8179488.1 3-dehydroquinate synthase [Paenibacillus sp. UMB4589-SE434]